MYQRDIDSSVDWSINTLPKVFPNVDKNGNHRVPDASGNYVGECISFVKREFTHRTGEPAPSTGTGWADGWLKLPGVLKKYFAVEGFNPSKTYPKGSYLVNSPTHHIAIYLGRSGTNVTVAHQNADPDGSGVHVSTREGRRFDMIMVPHVDADPPPAAPAPTPKPVVRPYSIERIAHKQVQLKIDTKRWGLNYDNWKAISNNPEGSGKAGDVFTAQAILHHDLGSSYYLEDETMARGYNVADCRDYTPPTPVSTPNPPVYTPPAAPMPVPTNTDPYDVVRILLAFTSANNAANHLNAVGTVKPGKYMVFNRREVAGKLVAVNVTKVQGKPGSWINPGDNVPSPLLSAPAPVKVEPPKPVPVVAIPAPVIPKMPEQSTAPNWRNSEQPLLHNYEAVRVVTKNEDPVIIHDLAGLHQDISLPEMKEIHIVSIFQKDGITYARTASARKNLLWYGVPWDLVSEEKRKLNFANVMGEVMFKLNMLIQDIKKYVK